MIAEPAATRDDLKAILEGVADAVTAQSPAGGLVYANDAAVRLLGFASAEEMLAASPAELVSRFDYYDEDGAPLSLDAAPRPARAGRRAPATADRALPQP